MSKSGNLVALTTLFNPADTPVLFYAEDPPFLPRILVFYWPVQTAGTHTSTSRIRITILSAAGFKSFAAFSVSPSSAYYSAVHKLPEDKQRDDVYRGIAFSLCRYFSEVPTEVKNAITEENLQHGIGLKWGQTHAAQITCRLSKVINIEEVVDALRPFSKDRPSSPPAPVRPLASIRKTRPSFLPPDSNSNANVRFGQVNTPTKRIPSSQSRRTPSSSTPGPRNGSQYLNQKQSPEQLESLRFKMCEFVDTEDRYISRLQQLIDLVMTQSRNPKSISAKSRGQKAANAMLQFPALLDTIKDLNIAFLDDLESSLQNTEDSAMAWLEKGQEGFSHSHTGNRDVVGAHAFAKVLLNHFPKFPMPYREYLDLHSQISSNLDQFLQDGTSSIQQAPSLLMEPAQRISRYGLYIDTMMPHLPPTLTVTIRTLEKARKIIAEICEMEPAASTILDSLRIEHEGKRRALSPTKLFSTLTRSNGTVRDAATSLTSREAPRLLPSLSRSFSRKTKPRPVLGEQDVDQANNVQAHRSDENRPFSNHTQSTSISKRLNTAGSIGASARTATVKSSPLQSKAIPATEKCRALEEENYKLLQENAELKQRLRLCSCQR